MRNLCFFLLTLLCFGAKFCGGAPTPSQLPTATAALDSSFKFAKQINNSRAYETLVDSLINDSRDKVSMLCKIATEFARLGKIKEADSAFSVAIAAANQDYVFRAEMSLEIAVALTNVGKTGEADSIFSAAFTIANKLPSYALHSNPKAEAFRDIAVALAKVGKVDTAISIVKQIQ